MIDERGADHRFLLALGEDDAARAGLDLAEDRFKACRGRV